MAESERPPNSDGVHLIDPTMDSSFLTVNAQGSADDFSSAKGTDSQWLQQSTEPRLWLSVAFGAAATFIMGGVVFGYSAFQNVLRDEEAFHNKCDDGTPVTDICAEQQVLLDFMYAISISALSAGMPFWGMLLDRFGPRVAFLCGAGGSILGSLLLGLKQWFLSFFLLGGAGTCVFMACITLSKTMPRHMSRINAIFIGVFDTSAVVLWVLRIIYYDKHPSLMLLFGIFSIICAVIALSALFLLPPLSAIVPIQTAYDSYVKSHEPKPAPAKANADPQSLNTPLLSEAAIPETQDLTDPMFSASSQVDNTKLPSVWSLAFQTRYVLLTLFMVVFNLKNSFFVATFQEQIDHLSHVSDHGADSIKTTFNLVFPIGGLASIPFSGWLLTRFKQRDSVIFLVLNLMGLIHGLTNLLPYLPSQFIAVFVFAVLRSMKWAAYTDFVCKHFLLQHVGRLLGMGNFVVGATGLLLYPLDWAVQHTFNGDFVAINSLLTGCEVVCLGFPLYLYFYEKQHRGQNTN